MAVVNRNADAGVDITTEYSLYILEAARNSLFWLNIYLSALDGNAANFTVKVYHYLAKSQYRVYTSGLLAKPVAADAIWDWTCPQPFYVDEGDSIEVRILSSNANDTTVAYNCCLIDPYADAYNAGNIRRTAPGGDFETTVNTSDTASSFTLSTDAPLTESCLVGHFITVEDAGVAGISETRMITAYAVRVVTVDAAFSFVPAVGDKVSVLGEKKVDVDYMGGSAVQTSGGYQQVDAVKVGGADPQSMYAVDTLVAAGTHSTTVFDISAGKTDGDYVGHAIEVEDANDSNIETRRITAWSNREVTVDRAFSFIPAEDDVARISKNMYGNVNVDRIEGSAAAAAIQSKCNDALVAQKLDHLIAVAESGDVLTNSIIGKLASIDGDFSKFAKSTDSLQALKDLLPAATIAAIKAMTGLTAGGTWTFQDLIKCIGAYILGTWQDKTGDATTQEILDAEDDATVILEIQASTTSPYRVTTKQ